METVGRALLAAALTLRLLHVPKKRWALTLQFSPEIVFQSLRKVLKFSESFTPVLLQRCSSQSRNTATEESHSSSATRRTHVRLRPHSSMTLITQSSVSSLRLETDRVNRMTAYCSGLERKASWVDYKEAKDTVKRQEVEREKEELRYRAKQEAEFKRWRDAENKRQREETRKRKEAEWLAAKEAARKTAKSKRIEAKDDLIRSADKLALSEHVKTTAEKDKRRYRTDSAESRKEFALARKITAPAPPPCEDTREIMTYRLQEALRRNKEIVGRIMNRNQLC